MPSTLQLPHNFLPGGRKSETRNPLAKSFLAYNSCFCRSFYRKRADYFFFCKIWFLKLVLQCSGFETEKPSEPHFSFSSKDIPDPYYPHKVFRRKTLNRILSKLPFRTFTYIFLEDFPAVSIPKINEHK